jgi:hypothetical protein
MTGHTPRRSWLRLGVQRCTCGRRAWHHMPSATGVRLADGDTVPYNGYPRTADILTQPRNQRSWR